MLTTERPDKLFNTRIITSALFVVLAIAGIGFSGYLLIIARSTYMYVLAICFAVLAAVSGLFNVFAASAYYRSYFYEFYLEKVRERLKPMKRLPTVAIVVPVYNEDTNIVKRTLARLLEIRYDKSKVRYYLADDSTNAAITGELLSFCQTNGIQYIRRESRKGFKAGNLNNALKYIKEEFIAVFDYDEYLTNRNFLIDLMPYFSDKKLAYLQTEKSYFNGNSLFSQSISLFDAFFYKFVQQARALDNTAIFAGSCGVIRKSVLEKVHGFPEFVIEDTFFSFLSDVEGYKSLYIPKVYALGKPITTFSQLVKQHWRYNYGDTQFLWYFYSNKKSKKLSFLSHIDYITHGLGFNYMSIILLLFTVMSVLIVFSASPFVTLSISQFFNSHYIAIDLEILGSAAFVMSLLVPVIITKIYFKSFKKGILILFLNFALVVVRTKAAIAAALNIDPAKVWIRQKRVRTRSLRFALQNTKVELAISASLVLFGILAYTKHNFAGGAWLFWYAFLYTLATAFFYLYG